MRDSRLMNNVMYWCARAYNAIHQSHVLVNVLFSLIESTLSPECSARLRGSTSHLPRPLLRGRVWEPDYYKTVCSTYWSAYGRVLGKRVDTRVHADSMSWCSHCAEGSDSGVGRGLHVDGAGDEKLLQRMCAWDTTLVYCRGILRCVCVHACWEMVHVVGRGGGGRLSSGHISIHVRRYLTHRIFLGLKGAPNAPQ